MKKGSGQRNSTGFEDWAKPYAAFLAFAALLTFIFLSKGLYLATVLVAAVVIGISAFIHRIYRNVR